MQQFLSSQYIKGDNSENFHPIKQHTCLVSGREQPVHRVP